MRKEGSAKVVQPCGPDVVLAAPMGAGRAPRAGRGRRRALLAQCAPVSRPDGGRGGILRRACKIAVTLAVYSKFRRTSC